MKSILISIKPEWVAKILNGDKTIEIRKTMPKCELPCKAYIYCTKDKNNLLYGNSYVNGSWEFWKDKTLIKDKTLVKGWDAKTGDVFDCCLANGKVVAEFTLNKIEELENVVLPTIPTCVYLTKTKRFASAIEKNSCLSQNEIYNYLGGKNGYAWYIDNLKIYDKPKELSEFGVKRAFQSWGYIDGKDNYWV